MWQDLLCKFSPGKFLVSSGYNKKNLRIWRKYNKGRIKKGYKFCVFRLLNMPPDGFRLKMMKHDEVNPCKITMFSNTFCTILQNFKHWKNIAQLTTSTEKSLSRIDIIEHIFFSLRYEMHSLNFMMTSHLKVNLCI